MPKPISRRELIQRLRTFGWEGPHPGGSHDVMANGARKITIPNPHRGDVDWSLTKRLLQRAGITPAQWAPVAEQKKQKQPKKK